MGRSIELLNRGEFSATTETSESKLEKRRLKLEAQIFAVKYRDQQEKVAIYNNDQSERTGIAVERKIVADLKTLGLM